jgi:hypothetical protein
MAVNSKAEYVRSHADTAGCHRWRYAPAQAPRRRRYQAVNKAMFDRDEVVTQRGSSRIRVRDEGGGEQSSLLPRAVVRAAANPARGL